jgi:hypothetical protein
VFLLQVVTEALMTLMPLAYQTREEDVDSWVPLLQDDGLDSVLKLSLEAGYPEAVGLCLEVMQRLAYHQSLFTRMRALRGGSFLHDTVCAVFDWHCRGLPAESGLCLRTIRLLSYLCARYGGSALKRVWADVGPVQLVPRLVAVIDKELSHFPVPSQAQPPPHLKLHATLTREANILLTAFGEQLPRPLKEVLEETNCYWLVSKINFRLMANMVHPLLAELVADAEAMHEAVEGKDS